MCKESQESTKEHRKQTKYYEDEYPRPLQTF